MQRKIALFLCALYLAFTVAHPILAPDIARQMSTLAFVTALSMGAIAIWGQRIPSSLAHAVNGFFAFAILANSLAHLVLTGRIEESTNVMLVILATGAVFYSWAWFGCIVSLSVASWIVITRNAFGTAVWGHYLFAIVLSILLAVVYHRIRVVGATRLANARAAEEERTFELADSNFELQRAARQLKDQARELEKQNEVLAENVRLKEEVERLSRHDLRTPVTSIISLSQMTRESPSLPAEHRASLELIEQAGYRVLNMANLTLDLFKMENGTFHLSPVPVNIAEVAERVLVDLRALLRTREVNCNVLTVGFGDHTPAILGDELLCHSMLMNLVKNAAEASDKGGVVRVEITAGDSVQIQIHNTAAIPAELRDRFLQKYATHGKKGGTGLGAYSAKLMAVTQGGDLRVESAESTGTTVTVELPRAHMQVPVATKVATAPLPQDDGVAHRVLIVDDDESNRAILRSMLAHPRWSIDEAENGPLAVRKFSECRFDVIFSDIEMPVMDGFELVRQIRAEEAAAQQPRATIVALSSHDDDHTRTRALAAGFDHYLQKPVRRRDLVELILKGSVPASSEASFDPAIESLMPLFLENKKQEIAAADDAVARNDYENACQAFHRLRGSFSMFGFPAAAEVCRQLEEFAWTHEPERGYERFNDLKRIMDNINLEYAERKNGA